MCQDFYTTSNNLGLTMEWIKRERICQSHESSI